MSEISRKYPPDITRKKMVDWCNKAERCQWDVRHKLMDWNTPATERELLISDLIASDLINEKRYAEAFAGDKSKLSRWGQRKIKQHLMAKGISERNIADAMRKINREDEKNTILHLIKKKESQLREPQLFLKKGKIIRFLLSRGFDHEMSMKYVEAYFSNA